MTIRMRLAAAATILMLAATSAVGLAGSISAQESTVDQVGGHLVALHPGTCDSPGAEAGEELGEAHLPGVGENDEGGDVRGSRAAMPVLMIDATVDQEFDDILGDDPYLIAVHESAENTGTVLACGEIGGLVQDGRLVIGLKEIDESGVTGVVIIDEDSTGILGLGDNELNFKVYLLSDATIAGEPVNPDASPTPITDDEGETDESVDMEGAATPEAEG